MASFKIHLGGAMLASGMAATAGIAIDLVPVHQAPILFGLGTVGGLLPDIDADNSTPVRLAFGLLGLVTAFVTVFHALAHYRFSIGELGVLGAGAFALVRYVIFELFLRLTEHRGVFHSLLAVAFFTFLTTALAYNVAHSPPRMAWIYGLFVGLGYLLHLLLDELFSVDLLGGRLKRSFGTALKPFGRDLRATLLMGLLTLGTWTVIPSPDSLHQILTRNHLWEPIRQRLWPNHGIWFAEFRNPARVKGEIDLYEPN